MARWPGMGDRIRERMITLGYEKAGRADITRFCLENRFLPANMYRWVNSSVLPDRANLLRLAEYLQVGPAWILFGADAEANKAPTPSGKRGRGPVRVGLLAGLLVLSGLLPTPSAASPLTRLGVVQVLDNIVSYQTWRRWLRRVLAHPLLPLPCPA